MVVEKFPLMQLIKLRSLTIGNYFLNGTNVLFLPLELTAN